MHAAPDGHSTGPKRRPPGRAEILELLRANGIEPSRALGQNFVVDPNVVERITRLARVGVGDKVVEIGAGLGSLTVALAATGASVTAVEIDRRIEPLLRSLVEPLGVRVLRADAMELSWDGLLGGDESAAGWVLVANLPYNIATPLVCDLLVGAGGIARMLVMVQKEVGERLAAKPGSPAYGAVSVRVAYFALAKIVGSVPPAVFVPRPRVASVLVDISRRSAPAVDPSEVSFVEIDRLVRAGFGGRRKMLRRSLAGLVDEAAYGAAGVLPTARPEELDVVTWGKLATCQRAISTARP